MNIFKFDDFREVIQEKIRENKNTRGYRSRMAEAANFQRSFLSHVVNGHVSITPEHALQLAHFWELSSLETEFFLNLVHLERSQSKFTKKYYLEKLIKIKEEQLNLTNRLEMKSDSIKIEWQRIYYSSWHWTAIHLCTSIPNFQTVSSISAKLRIDEPVVSRVLNQLEKMSLVIKKGNRWTILKRHVHLEAKSGLSAMNHFNWRQRAIADVQEVENPGLHYSVLYGLSQKDADKIKNMLVEFISSAKKVVDPSPEENLFCFLCDFFPV